MNERIKAGLVIIICFAGGLGCGLWALSPKEISTVGKEEESNQHSAVLWKKIERRWDQGQQSPTKTKIRNLVQRVLLNQKPINWKEEAETFKDACLSEDLNEKMGMLIFFSKWADHDLDELLNYLKDNEIYDFFGEAVLAERAKRYPEEMAEFYMKNKAGDKNEILGVFPENGFLGQIAKHWAARSPEKAWEWLNSLDMEERGSVLVSFISSLDTDNPSEMTRYLDEAKSSGLPLEESLKWWGRKNYNEAKKWLLSLPEGDQIKLAGTLISAGMAENYDDAMTLRPLLEKREKGDESYAQLAKQMSLYRGDEEAMSWLGEKWIKNKAATMEEIEVFRKWSYLEPEITRKWMMETNIEPGSLRDDLLAAYAESVTSDGMDEPLEKAVSIEDASKREAVLRNIIGGWSQYDENAAIKWLETYSGSEKEKEAIRKEIERKRR